MRRAILAAAVVAALLPTATGASPPPASLARIDPALATSIVRGPAPALLWWDEAQATRTEVARYLRGRGIEARLFERLSGGVACASSAGDLAALAAAPGAVGVWGDRPLKPSLDRSVPTAFDGDPNAVWQGEGITGAGVGIAVVDTGIDATHPDLQFGTRTKLNVRVLFSHRDNIWVNGDSCYLQDTYTDQLPDTELTSGHGTHVTSVAAGDGTASAGRYRGVAPGADIVGVAAADTFNPNRRFDDPQYQIQISLISAIGGINYALLNALEGPTHLKVILAGWTQDGMYDPWNPMAWAIEDSHALGVNVVLPAGNEGPAQSDCSAPATCLFNAWAAAPTAIAVAATPHESRTELAGYSSRGDPIARLARAELVRYQPTVSAPGTGVVAARRPGIAPVLTPPESYLGAWGDGGLSTDLDYVALTGTSIAAAHVAGAIALMQQAAVEARGCFLAPQQVKEILASTATPMDGYGAHEVGAGAMHVPSAIAASRTAPLVPPFDFLMCPPGG